MANRLGGFGVTVVAVATAVVLAACGGGDGGDGGGSGDPQESKFASLGCASCHTLKAADASGGVGPNLDEVKPDAATVERMLRNGGGGMPSFEDELSDSELRELAAWVAKNAG